MADKQTENKQEITAAPVGQQATSTAQEREIIRYSTDFSKGIFGSSDNFMMATQMAKAFAQSTICLLYTSIPSFLPICSWLIFKTSLNSFNLSLGVIVHHLFSDKNNITLIRVIVNKYV